MLGRRLYPILILAAIAAPLLAAPAIAEVALGQFGDWEAFSDKEGENTVCFMASEAAKSRGDYKQRGRTYVMVTHRPADKSNNVVSIQAGYTYKKDSQAEIVVGEQSFKLFTSGTYAFAPDAKTDEALIKAMIKGTGMTIKGYSGRGTLTTDTYSLKGFTAAHKATRTACKL